MHISDFDYELPRELIAQEPLPERDASRLLVTDRNSDRMEHRNFHELPELLDRGDRLVVNDTRVLPARLLGQREGGSTPVEVLLTNAVEGKDRRPTFEALTRPARKLTRGTTVFLGPSRTRVEVLEELDDKRRLVEFPEGFRIIDFLNREGHVPLPPYIHRDDTAADRERYQTIFAQRPGAVAAPTAGLHFTPRLLEALGTAGVPVTTITLNVGVGTFAPVVEADPRDHVMEREYYRITPEAAEEITATRKWGGKIVAVGTTVVRALETAAAPMEPEGKWTAREGDGWAEKFIYPPYDFRLVDALITNFHLPRSTLLMLVSAFGGPELTRRAYREAVTERYRFYSYGDAMLVL
jgi:S-adenosylmethionine:tRNA ribosyltransferase-isomerase